MFAENYENVLVELSLGSHSSYQDVQMCLARLKNDANLLD